MQSALGILVFSSSSTHGSKAYAFHFLISCKLMATPLSMSISSNHGMLVLNNQLCVTKELSFDPGVENQFQCKLHSCSAVTKF